MLGIKTMPVAKLTISDWGATGERDTFIEKPSWPQVERAVCALNNENLNDLYLYPEENNAETYLCVGGGAGRYILTGSINNRTFPTLVDPSRSSTTTSLVVGGQPGDYPSNWIADLSTTLKTTKAFFDAGIFECGVTWGSV